MMMLQTLVTSALLTATSVSARCLSSLLPLPLSAVNFDLDDPSWSTTYPVSGTFNVAVEYCPPSNAVSSHSNTLLLSLPGGTYGPVYWDFSFQPENYSFVRYANARGFATLNVARIGSGLSDHPDPIKVLQMPLQIAAIVELVERARNGAWERPYANIVGLGHSLSSGFVNGVVVQEPTVFDGVVLTGYAHNIINEPPVTSFPNANTAGIPRFAGLPDGYVTSPRGARSGFYGPAGTYDPEVVEHDEAHKDVVALGEYLTYQRFDPVAPRFRGHVLAANGQYDAITCPGPACETIKDEARAYLAAASFEAVVVPQSGHDVNLNLGAQQFFETVISWLERHSF
ncbi:alpha/beta-hydrolase [Auricularia subglabra TFB-10046 SS5]|nr:alpha/beta-hydrolase [Auricularia subglabra TFB-10046 SS5]